MAAAPSWCSQYRWVRRGSQTSDSPSTVGGTSMPHRSSRVGITSRRAASRPSVRRTPTLRSAAVPTRIIGTLAEYSYMGGLAHRWWLPEHVPVVGR